eukprot:m.234360 g.234360  ORF g.234360 m.234360 type:complete len:1685 (+) comp17086_c0_seq2:68-5122(+)
MDGLLVVGRAGKNNDTQQSRQSRSQQIPIRAKPPAEPQQQQRQRRNHHRQRRPTNGADAIDIAARNTNTSSDATETRPVSVTGSRASERQQTTTRQQINSAQPTRNQAQQSTHPEPKDQKTPISTVLPQRQLPLDITNPFALPEFDGDGPERSASLENIESFFELNAEPATKDPKLWQATTEPDNTHRGSIADESCRQGETAVWESVAHNPVQQEASRDWLPSAPLERHDAALTLEQQDYKGDDSLPTSDATTQNDTILSSISTSQSSKKPIQVMPVVITQEQASDNEEEDASDGQLHTIHTHTHTHPLGLSLTGQFMSASPKPSTSWAQAQHQTTASSASPLSKPFPLGRELTQSGLRVALAATRSHSPQTMHMFCMKEALGATISPSFASLHLSDDDTHGAVPSSLRMAIPLPVTTLDLNLGEDEPKTEQKLEPVTVKNVKNDLQATGRQIDEHLYKEIPLRFRPIKPVVRARDFHMPAEVVDTVAPVFSKRMLELENPNEDLDTGSDTPIPTSQFFSSTSSLFHPRSLRGGTLDEKQDRVVDRESKTRLDAIRALLSRVNSEHQARTGRLVSTTHDEQVEDSTSTLDPETGNTENDVAVAVEDVEDASINKAGSNQIKQTNAFYETLEFIAQVRLRRERLLAGLEIHELEESEQELALRKQYETLMQRYNAMQEANEDPLEQARLLSQLGDVSLHLSRPDASLGFLQSAISLIPRVSHSYWLLHIAYLVLGNRQSALEALEQCIRLQPDYKAYRAKAQILHDDAANARQTVAALQMAIIYNGQDATAYYMKAELEETLGNSQQAASDLLMVLEVDPDHLHARRKYAQVLFERGSYRQSIKHLTALIVAMPADANLYFQRALANSRSGEHVQALRDITQCIHLDPNNKLAYFNRALMLSRAHPYRAIRDLSIVLLIDSSHEVTIEAYLRRGMLYASMHQHKEALPDLLACLASEELRCLRNGAASKTLVTVLCQLGLLNLRQLGKYATAIKYFTKALGVDPGCEDAILARAECYRQLDKQSRAFESDYSDQTLRRALRDYMRLVHISPGNIQYRLLCGKTALEIGLTKAAEATLSGARRLTRHLGTTPSLQTEADIFLGYREEAIAVLCRTIWPSSSAAAPVTNVADHLAQNHVEGGIVATYFPALGRALLRSERIQEAVAVFQHMIDVGSETADVYYHLGLCCLKLGDEHLALSLFDRAVSMDNTHALALFERAKSKLKLGLPRVLVDVNRALEKDPTLWPAYLTRAAFYAQQHRLPKAILNCNKALAIEPAATRALIMRGCLKLLNKTLDLGIRDLSDACEMDPANPLAFFNRGVGYHMLGNYQIAIRDYSAVLLYSKGESYRKQILLNRALAYMSLNENESALSDLLELLRSRRHARNPALLHTTALCFYRHRAYVQAVDYFSRAIDLDKHFVQAYLGRGNALLDMNTIRSRRLAKRDFLRALHVDPRFTPAYHNLAVCLQTAGHLKQAYRVLSHAITSTPTNTVLLEARAIVALQVQELHDAYRDLSQAITIRPSAKLYNARGVVQLYMKQGHAAVADFRAAIAADSTYVLPYYNLANVFLAKRQLRQAVTLFNQACELSPMIDDDLYNNRAICKCYIGQQEDALEDLRMAATQPHCNTEVIFNLALLSYQLGHLEDANKAISKYLDQVDHIDTVAERLRALIRASQHADNYLSKTTS